jgi:hypothetical protein
VALRVGSLTLSPVLWIAILLLCAKAGVMSALLFLLAAAAVQGVTAIANFAALRLPPLNPLRSIPQLPVRLGGIIRIALRQMLSVLDFYVSAILSLAAIAYRTLSAHPDPEAFPICAVLVALGLSTFAQQMFGLDSASGIARYRLMPLAGWKILLGKDIAYFTVLILLVLPLNLGAGLTFGLAAVALGRYPSLRPHHAQLRRRFVSGDWRFGACQIIAGFALGISNARLGSWFFAGAAAMYVASLFAGGWFWDHRQDP